MPADVSPTAIEQKLRTLRARVHPDLSDRAFAKLAKISYTQVQRMEGRRGGRALKRDFSASPTVERLRLYLAACDYSMTRFFADIEQEKPATKRRDPATLKIHRRLDQILEYGNEVRRRIEEHFDELEAWAARSEKKKKEA